jgi:hypothetical protein
VTADQLSILRTEIASLHDDLALMDEASSERDCAIGFLMVELARADVQLALSPAVMADLFSYPVEELTSVTGDNLITPLELAHMARPGGPLDDCSFSAAVEVSEEQDGPLPDLYVCDECRARESH